VIEMQEQKRRGGKDLLMIIAAAGLATVMAMGGTMYVANRMIKYVANRTIKNDAPQADIGVYYLDDDRKLHAYPTFRFTEDKGIVTEVFKIPRGDRVYLLYAAEDEDGLSPDIVEPDNHIIYNPLIKLIDGEDTMVISSAMNDKDTHENNYLSAFNNRFTVEKQIETSFSVSDAKGNMTERKAIVVPVEKNNK